MSQRSSYSAANRGALTTIFSPPESCLSQTTLVSYLTTVSSISGSAKFTTTKIFINHFSWGDSSCYPSTIATVDGQTKWGNGYYYCTFYIPPLNSRVQWQYDTNNFSYSPRYMSLGLDISLRSTYCSLPRRLHHGPRRRHYWCPVLPFFLGLCRRHNHIGGAWLQHLPNSWSDNHIRLVCAYTDPELYFTNSNLYPSLQPGFLLHQCKHFCPL